MRAGSRPAIKLLGLPAPPLPASDFIGHIIFWDQQTTQAMAAKIEAVTGLDWIEALCRTRDFSEYMLYGYFVENDAGFSARHIRAPRTQCVSYWDQPKLNRGELNQLLRRADKDDVAFSVASFSGTPVETIRAAVEENTAVARACPPANRGARRAMLIGQASINLSANVLSALLGLLSVFIFTRLFSPHDYGVYLLGMAFAAVVSVFLAGWFRNLIMSRHARDDGTDVRGLVVSGYLVGCLAAPAAYGLGRLLGLDAMEALAAVVLAVAIGVFELTQELVRARLMVVTAMKATLVRAVAALGLGVAAAFLGKTGILLLVSSTLAYLLAVLVQRSAWRGTVLKFDGAGLMAAAKQGLPLTLSLTLLAISSVADRFIIANLISTADAGTICRRSRPGPAGRDDAGVQHRRRLCSAGDPDQRQSGNAPRCSRISANASNCC